MGSADHKQIYSAGHTILPLNVVPPKQHPDIHPPRASLYWQRLTLITFVILSLSIYRTSTFLLNKRPSSNGTRNPAYLIHAHSGAVASENKRCSDIGVQVLKEGGNAVDAAIAATFCTGVVNMFSCVQLMYLSPCFPRM